MAHNFNVFAANGEICFTEDSNEHLPIKITNTGGKLITNMVLNVIIPTGLIYKSHSASTGTYNSGTQEWTISSIAPDVTHTLEMCFTIDDPAEAPFVINYSATSAEYPDAVNDDAASRKFEGFRCSEFDNCWANLQEFDTMEEAIEELGPGKLFIASLSNTEGWSWRQLLLTPFP